MARDDVGFIECDPKFHVGAEGGDDSFSVALEICREEVIVGKATLLCEPQGEGPVPQCDEGLDVPLPERCDDGAVMYDGGFVEDALGRFDP